MSGDEVRFYGNFKVPPLTQEEGETVCMAVFDQQVEAVTREIAELLKAKNRAYGDSALNPVRIFSRTDSAEQIRVRIDDKLSRMARGSAAGEDVILDLMGYLVLLRIAEGKASK